SSPRAARPVATLLHTVAHGKRVGSWKTRMRDGSGRSTTAPSARIDPVVGGSRPDTKRSSVDLPQPAGPSLATKSPAQTERLIDSSTGSREPPRSNSWLTFLRTTATLFGAGGALRSAVAAARLIR